MGTREQRSSQREYALGIARSSHEWYESRAITARRVHKSVEVAIMATSVSIPAAAATWPERALVPALLGALVALLAGLRTIYHWHDNYLRFSEAREAVNREIRLFEVGAAPYDDERHADQHLVRAVSAIEQNEMGRWLQIVAARPNEPDPDASLDVETPRPVRDS